jgi:hypothetical protein
MHFQKQDLAATHYHWKDETDFIYTGQPSRRSFDRFNGNQVLFLINFMGSIPENFTISEGRQIEEEIEKRLPIDLKSEVSVFNWIREVVFSKLPAQ